MREGGREVCEGGREGGRQGNLNNVCTSRQMPASVRTFVLASDTHSINQNRKY